jgi:hypothetical protein
MRQILCPCAIPQRDRRTFLPLDLSIKFCLLPGNIQPKARLSFENHVRGYLVWTERVGGLDFHSSLAREHLVALRRPP